MIDELLKERGKSRYWLAKQIGISQNNLKNLADNNTVMVRFDVLEKCCKALGCGIEELLHIED